MPSYAQSHIAETARVARAVHARMMREGPRRFHVYYKTLVFECFQEDETVDREVWTLAFPEHVPTYMTVDQLVMWFAARTGRVPYLPTDDK